MTMIFIVLLMTVLGALSLWLSPLTRWELDQETSAVIGGIIGLVISGVFWLMLARYLRPGSDGLKRWWQATLLALIGGLTGALFWWLIAMMFNAYSPFFITAGGLLSVMMMVMGFALGIRGPVKWSLLWNPPMETASEGKPKVLDTSVIIDGRLGDLVETGFIQGNLILTPYVLQELHGIADSSDPLRRRKGRRGLDILGDLRRSKIVKLETVEYDVSQHRDVDHKLIEIAKMLKADLITTDFNLNKVAKVEGVQVLNINELANSIKPRYLPGEELDVEVLDKGEEAGQGVGYLDDGTMVVVENGRNKIGKTVHVVVSSTLQTDAGKMLFVKVQNNQRPSS